MSRKNDSVAETSIVLPSTRQKRASFISRTVPVLSAILLSSFLAPIADAQQGFYINYPTSTGQANFCLVNANGKMPGDLFLDAVGATTTYWVVNTSTPSQSQTASTSPVGDPINPSIGNVYTTEEDVRFAGPGTISFRRFYNSADARGMDAVPGWRNSYDRSINTSFQTSSTVYPGSSWLVSTQ